jgi:hypothetical protein
MVQSLSQTTDMCLEQAQRLSSDFCQEMTKRKKEVCNSRTHLKYRIQI